jgi:hypothetical protein
MQVHEQCVREGGAVPGGPGGGLLKSEDIDRGKLILTHHDNDEYALECRFTNNVFVKEEQFLVGQEVAFEHVPFASNQGVIELFEGRAGLFNLLDDEVRCEPKSSVDDSALTIMDLVLGYM